MHEVIAVGGYRDHGKDSVIKILKKNHGFCREAWADHLCVVVGSVYSLSNEEVEMLKGLTDGARHWRVTPNPKFNGLTPVKVLQEIGMKFRSINPDCWVNYLVNRIKKHQYGQYDYRAAIAGTRFKNEVLGAQLELNGKFWFVERPSFNKDTNHIAEQEIESLKAMADLVIVNDGTLEDLELKVRRAIKESQR